MLRVALKSLLSHKIRSVFLAICVVLGVSFVSGTYVLTDTILATFDGIFSEVYASTDVTVRSSSEFGDDAARTPVPESLLTTVRAVDGVAGAEGSVFNVGAEIIGRDGDRVGNPQAPTFGLEWSTDDALTPLVLRTGRKPANGTEVAIDARSFADAGYALGEQITIVLASGPRRFTLVGVAGFGKADNIAGATLTMFDLATAQEVMGRTGVFDSISVRADPGVSAEILQERVQAVLPSGTEAVTSETLSEDTSKTLEQTLGFFRTFMLAFAYISLFVGAFIIYNTFSIVVVQRTRELALLRAIGATGRQVLTSVIVEALAIGFVASVAGLAAGVAMASGLEALLSTFGFDVPDGPAVVALRTVIVALVGGTLVTTVSAIAPAMRAARVPPIAAMQDTVIDSHAAAVRRNVAGLIGTVLGTVLVLTGLGRGSLMSVGVGALLLFLGVSMLAPVVARPAAALLGRPIKATRGAAGLLARQNAMRSARRTATTASALMIGTALLAASVILSSSVTESVDRAVDRGAVADLVVRGGGAVGFSPAAAVTAREVVGVRAAYALRVGAFKIDGAKKQLTGIDPAALDVRAADVVIDPIVTTGDIARLGTDGIAVHDDVAKDHGWKVGDALALTFPTGAQDLTIVALYAENQLVGDYVISLATYEAHNATATDFLVLLTIADGADLATVQASVRAALDAGYPGIEVQTKAEYVGDVKAQVNQLLGLITALLGLAILIALVGVLITMLLAVFERTHELGLLRAVGMSRGQLRAMVRWEAAIISVFGALLGAALGVFFGYALTSALGDLGLTVIVIPWVSLMVLVLVIAVLGVGAALYPARRAGRLNVLDAVSRQ